MEAPSPLSVDRVDSQDDVRRDGAPPHQPTMPPPPVAELERLMLLADRYARKLVAVTDPPSDALMIVHQGALDILPLDGRTHVSSAVCRLLAEYQASSAALIVHSGDAEHEATGHACHIIGETADGVRDARHYRVRGCGKSRRLTPRLGRDVDLDRDASAYLLFARSMVAAPVSSRVAEA